MNRTIETLMKDIYGTDNLESIYALKNDLAINKAFKLADEAAKTYDILGEYLLSHLR